MSGAPATHTLASYETPETHDEARPAASFRISMPRMGLSAAAGRSERPALRGPRGSATTPQGHAGSRGEQPDLPQPRRDLYDSDGRPSWRGVATAAQRPRAQFLLSIQGKEPVAGRVRR